MNIENKVAIVTGGASGLGLGTVKALVEKGAKVVIFDLNEKNAKQACNELVSYAVVNVSDEAAVQAGIQQTVEQHGALHICVNCAGVGIAEKIIGRSGVIPFENFKRVVDINLYGTFNVLRLAAEQMAKNEPLTDSGERGVVINTASIAAFEGQMGQTAYGASKAAVVGLTLPAARDLSSFGIRVNTIAPGLFRTPLAELLDDRVVEKLEKSVEFPKRFGRPDEYADLVQFMIENEYINGEVVRLDGSIRMSPR